MFFTLNRFTLQLNMLFDLKHVFHAEPLHTSAKHALVLHCSKLLLRRKISVINFKLHMLAGTRAKL